MTIRQLPQFARLLDVVVLDEIVLSGRNFLACVLLTRRTHAPRFGTDRVAHRTAFQDATCFGDLSNNNVHIVCESDSMVS